MSILDLGGKNKMAYTGPRGVITKGSGYSYSAKTGKITDRRGRTIYDKKKGKWGGGSAGRAAKKTYIKAHPGYSGAPSPKGYQVTLKGGQQVTRFNLNGGFVDYTLRPAKLKESEGFRKLREKLLKQTEDPALSGRGTSWTYQVHATPRKGAKKSSTTFRDLSAARKFHQEQLAALATGRAALARQERFLRTPATYTQQQLKRGQRGYLTRKQRTQKTGQWARLSRQGLTQLKAQRAQSAKYETGLKKWAKDVGL